MQAIHRLEWFVGLILLQVLVLNHVHVGEYATPFLYTYFLLSLNADTSRTKVLWWGFSLGLIIDIFSNTPGLNAAASTFLALIRNPLLRSQTMRDIADDFRPSILTMGLSPFLRYIIVGAFLHILVLQLIDTFSFFRLVPLLLKVLVDTLFTAICMICIDVIRRKK